MELDSSRSMSTGVSGSLRTGAPRLLIALQRSLQRRPGWQNASFGRVPALSVNPLYPGERREFTPLDWAGLQDIGWHTDHLAVTSEPPA